MPQRNTCCKNSTFGVIFGEDKNGKHVSMKMGRKLMEVNRKQWQTPSDRSPVQEFQYETRVASQLERFKAPWQQEPWFPSLRNCFQVEVSSQHFTTHHSGGTEGPLGEPNDERHSRQSREKQGRATLIGNHWHVMGSWKITQFRTKGLLWVFSTTCGRSLNIHFWHQVVYKLVQEWMACITDVAVEPTQTWDLWRCRRLQHFRLNSKPNCRCCDPGGWWNVESRPFQRLRIPFEIWWFNKGTLQDIIFCLGISMLIETGSFFQPTKVAFFQVQDKSSW